MLALGLAPALISACLPSSTELAPVPLWTSGPPDALGRAEKDSPTITPFLCDSRAEPRAAVVICPGGGYGMLAPHEGRTYALFLNRAGLNCFVLKYRLGSDGYRHPAMLHDAARAVRLVRSRAKDWGVDPTRVAIMGSSAGGHLASTLLTHWDKGDPNAVDPVDRESSRPDLGVLCYAVITMGPNTHEGSKENLLGKNPDPKLVRFLSNELQVTAETPPCFVWHTQQDQTVKVDNALAFAAALQSHGVPFELHIYEKGGHGMGLATEPPAFNSPHPWVGELLRWLKERGFVE
jgi:acetyl esterase/lipase